MTKMITCAMCGTEFDPVTNPACGACPLHAGCTAVCCPKCGYSTINHEQSKLVKMFSVFFPKKTTEIVTTSGSMTLADVKPGKQTNVTGFASNLSSARLAHLQAYGLVQGYPVRVVQQRPVTVIQVDFVELALEEELARGVFVDQP